jgi:hypothetical protein
MTTLSSLLTTLEELEAKATKGKWTFNGENIFIDGVVAEGTHDDGDFVVASRNSLPILLQAAREKEVYEKAARGMREALETISTISSSPTGFSRVTIAENALSDFPLPQA